MAVSLNSFIAADNGSEDFLSHDNWLVFINKAKKVGCIIWGRTTHEAVLRWPKNYLEDLKGIVKIVISSDKNYGVGEDFELANSPEQALELLKSKGFSETIVTGGSTTNAEFAKRKLINKVSLTMQSVILGTGIPLFKKGKFEMKLKLTNLEKISDDLIELNYEVI
jgi:dihydrofolate reductase